MGEAKSDDMDMDGMGNFSRFPVDKMPNKIYFKTKNSKIKKEEVK
jgi:hypothetical protein